MTIQPALTPLHPDKPPREIVAGETWTKKAWSGNTPSKPRVTIIRRWRHYIEFRDHLGNEKRHTERVFRETYE